MAQDFEMFSGDSKNLEITVKDEDGLIVNIDGAVIRWQLARSARSKEPTLKKSSETSGEISITGGITGIFTVHLLPEDTENLAGAFYHEAEVELSDGTVGTVTEGTVTIVFDLIKKQSGS